MIPKSKILEIKKSIKRNCENCLFYTPPSFDYEEGHTEEGHCNKKGKENLSCLKSFPFKKEQKCFSLDFHLIDYLDSDLRYLAEKFWMSSGIKQKFWLFLLSKLRAKRYKDLY